MSLEAKIFDEKDSPEGKPVMDQPEGFFSVAINHARKSPHRFPLLGRVDMAVPVSFEMGDREGLKTEWLMLESLAIGRNERDKWTVLFRAFNKQETFQRLEFASS